MKGQTHTQVGRGGRGGDRTEHPKGVEQYEVL